MKKSTEKVFINSSKEMQEAILREIQIEACVLHLKSVSLNKLVEHLKGLQNG